VRLAARVVDVHTCADSCLTARESEYHSTDADGHRVTDHGADRDADHSTDRDTLVDATIANFSAASDHARPRSVLRGRRCAHTAARLRAS
jgi:hypothetical protein